MKRKDVDYTHRYGRYNRLLLKYGVLCGKVDMLLTCLVEEALYLGRWHRCGDTVFLSYYEEQTTIEVLACPSLDNPFSVVTGTAIGGGFDGKRLDRETTMLLARTCWY